MQQVSIRRNSRTKEEKRNTPPVTDIPGIHCEVDDSRTLTTVTKFVFVQMKNSQGFEPFFISALVGGLITISYK